jgi:hypothetical protein
MITINYLIKRAEAFYTESNSAGHFHSFGKGRASDMISEPAEPADGAITPHNYPLLWVEPINFLPDFQAAAPYVRRYMSFYFLDALMVDMNNYVNALSDMEIEALDFIQWFKLDGASKGFSIESVENSQQLIDTTQDKLAGWQVKLVIACPRHQGSCYINV